MGSVRFTGSLLGGIACVVLFSSCSNVAFEKNPNGTAATCNGSSIACSTTNPGVNDYNYDYTVPTPKVDILFVVDNSASMVPDQDKLATAFDNFAYNLGNADWQVGITTTDMTPSGMGGKLVDISTSTGTTKILTSQYADYNSAFNGAVRQSDTGSNDERGLLSALKLVQSRPAGFIRDDSHFAVVILSDEDERSVGKIGTNDASLNLVTEETPRGYVDAMNATLQARPHSLYSIIIRPGDAACLQQQQTNQPAGYYGQRYFEAQKIISKELYGTDITPNSAEVGSICNSDYNPIMAIIGNSIKGRVEPITLPCHPIDSIAYVNGAQVSVPARVLPTTYSPGTTLHLQFKCS